MSDINDLIMYLPKAGNNQSIAVGFEDESALYPLKKILWDIKQGIKKDSDDRDDENTLKQTRTVEEFKKQYLKDRKEEISRETKENEKRKKTLYEILQGILDNAKYAKDTKNILEKSSQYLLRWGEYLIEAFDKQLESAMKVGGVYRDLESSGVFLKNGFDDLGKTAYNLGMTYEDLSGHLKKSSPILARLNGSMGDGLKAFESTISNIDKNLNLTNSEKVAVFENVLNNLSPDQLMKMSQEDMNVEINKTAKEMKMLSMATGKSVELINKENEAKARTLRENVWKRTHRQAYATLQSLGITEDSELMEYIMTGGTKITAGIVTKMQNDPFMQKMLPMLAKNATINNLNSQTLSSIYKQNAHLATYKSSYADKASFDPSRIMASGVSDLFQNTQFYDFNDMYFKNANLSSDMSNQYYSSNRLIANRALGNMQSLAENRNRYNVAKLNATSGGEKGVSQASSLWSNIYGAGASAVNLYNDYGPKGMLGGVLATFAASGAKNAIKIFGDSWFFRSVLRFDKAVNKFRKIKDESNINWKKIGSILSRGVSGIGGAAVGTFGLYRIFGENKEGKSMSLGALEGGMEGAIAGAALGYSFFGTGKAAIGGALAGAGIGSILAIGKNLWDNIENDSFDLFSGGYGDAALTGAIMGAAIGGKFGGLKGAAYGMVAGALGLPALKGAMALIKKYFGGKDEESIEINKEIKTSSYINDKSSNINYSSPQIKQYANTSVYNSASLTTPYQSEQLKVMKEMCYYTKQNVNQNQCLIDAAEEGNKLSYQTRMDKRTSGSYEQ